MATLRLFANLRETAGTSSADFAGSTVGEVIAGAVAAYGGEFEKGLETAKIWVNGDPATASTRVRREDEIALIPPVSGGAVAATGRNGVLRALLVAALVLAVTIGNFVSAEVFVFVTIGTAMAWLWDLRDVMAIRRAPLEMIPAMAAAAAAGNGAYGWGIDGFAGGLIVGLMIVLTWSIFDRRARSVEAIANAALLALVAGLATGGLTLAHLRAEEEVALFLVIAAVASLAAWAAARYVPPTAAIDPNVAGLLAALAAGIVASVADDTLTTAVMILASVGVGAGFIAGRMLGAVTRIGSVVHTARAPGLLTMFDGPVVAAGLFWTVVAIFA